MNQHSDLFILKILTWHDSGVNVPSMLQNGNKCKKKLEQEWANPKCPKDWSITVSIEYDLSY